MTLLIMPDDFSVEITPAEENKYRMIYKEYFKLPKCSLGDDFMTNQKELLSLAFQELLTLYDRFEISLESEEDKYVIVLNIETDKYSIMMGILMELTVQFYVYREKVGIDIFNILSSLSVLTSNGTFIEGKTLGSIMEDYRESNLIEFLAVLEEMIYGKH